MSREWRFDHSWDNRGYDQGKARNQLVFRIGRGVGRGIGMGMDLIFKF